MKAICVYCGSSPGRQTAYRAAAEALAEALVERQLSLVFGGASVGIMGAIADKVISLGGQAIGVIPKSIADKEIAHDGLTTLHVTRSMHERKTLMAELADGFIALPGGIGTFEELFEIWTWAQLGFHRKPVGLMNTAGYFDSLVQFLQHAVKEEFVQPLHQSMLTVEAEPGQLLDRFQDYQAPNVEKWLS